jgi:hypothetical protein
VVRYGDKIQATTSASAVLESTSTGDRPDSAPNGAYVTLLGSGTAGFLVISPPRNSFCKPGPTSDALNGLQAVEQVSEF